MTLGEVVRRLKNLDAINDEAMHSLTLAKLCCEANRIALAKLSQELFGDPCADQRVNGKLAFAVPAVAGVEVVNDLP